jgi:hypothetical protein
LYYSTAYIDGQKVTAQNETLVRMSTYSPMQRRMLSIASALMQFESERNMRHFAEVLKRLFSKGWESGEKEEDRFWDRIEGFELTLSDTARTRLQGRERHFRARSGAVRGEVFGWTASIISRKVCGMLRRTFQQKRGWATG